MNATDLKVKVCLWKWRGFMFEDEENDFHYNMLFFSSVNWGRTVKKSSKTKNKNKYSNQSKIRGERRSCKCYYCCSDWYVSKLLSWGFSTFTTKTVSESVIVRWLNDVHAVVNNNLMWCFSTGFFRTFLEV